MIAIGVMISMWLLLIFFGVSISSSLLFTSTVYMLYAGFGVNFIVQRMVDGINNFTILAVPLFILTGNLLNNAGITDRLFNFAKVLTGHIVGGLGHVNVLASLFFSGMSGSALADSGGLGQLEIKLMREAGFDDDFSGAVTAASSIIGPIIPPSIVMVMYGVISNTSIGKLFLGGMIPGLLASVSLMILVYIIAKKRQYPTMPKASFKTVITEFKASFLALLTPFIIIIGIFSGKFSPTEAAAITALYSLFLSFFVYKEMTGKKLWNIVYDTACTSASIGILIAVVNLFSFILAREQIPHALSSFFLSFTTNAITFLIIVNIMIFVLGAFIESMAIMLTMVPMLSDIASNYGIDPIQFGLIIVMNLMISTLTPPMGVSLFVVSKVGNIPYEVLARGILIWLIPPIVVLLLITFIPEIVTFIPNLMM